MTLNGRLMRAGVLFCGLCLAAGAVVAQEAPPPPPAGEQGPPPGPRGRGPEQRIEMMQKELNLTPDQTAKVRSIFAADRDKMMAIRNDSSLSQEDRRDKMMKLQHEQSEKIKGVLDDAQKPKFDAMQARMRDRMQERREGGAPPAPSGDTAPPPPPPPPQN